MYREKAEEGCGHRTEPQGKSWEMGRGGREKAPVEGLAIGEE